LTTDYHKIYILTYVERLLQIKIGSAKQVVIKLLQILKIFYDFDYLINHYFFGTTLKCSVHMKYVLPMIGSILLYPISLEFIKKKTINKCALLIVLSIIMITLPDFLFSEATKIWGKEIIVFWKLGWIVLIIINYAINYKSKPCLKNEYWWVEPQTKFEFYIGIICIFLTIFLMCLVIIDFL